MTTWEKFFSSWSEKPAFDFHDVKVTAGRDVAFATAIGRVRWPGPQRKARRSSISTDHVSPKD